MATLADPWAAFFECHALPPQTEQAFRVHLAQQGVPPGTLIQDLRAHYDQFLRQGGPGTALRGRTMAP
jgi:hypothetical protein